MGKSKQDNGRPKNYTERGIQLGIKKVVASDGNGRRIYSEETRRRVIDMLLHGASRSGISRALGVGPKFVEKVWREFRQEANKHEESTVDQFNGKVRKQARRAVEAGLACNRDPYKRATLGIKVLEGIGDFKTGDTNVHINAVLSSVPVDWQQKYIGNITDISAKEVKEITDGSVRDEPPKKEGGKKEGGG